MKLERILSAAVNSMIHGHHNPHCYHAHKPGQGYTNDGSLVNERADYLRQLERTASSEVENMGFAPDYAEPGYDTPRNGVLLADWNSLPSNLDSILERAGYAVEWSDEWSTCDSCNRIVRTSPNSYGWRRSYVLYNDCEIICADCVREDLDTYESHLLNNPRLADTLDVDWSARGFRKANADHYENGFHPGQNDNPEDIAKTLQPTVDYLFAIPSVGQFDVSFDCWIRDKEDDEL